MAQTKTSTYVIAARPGAVPPPDWQRRLTAVDGVAVSGATATRARFTATPEALERIRGDLSSWFHLEESVERDPQ
ncbi:MAG TPA: hypothetical protein VIE43_14800 [Thermoanaerobaculia bacterium]|nr:hypothetical protein [Thermoanaerobaculia bacterium]